MGSEGADVEARVVPPEWDEPQGTALNDAYNQGYSAGCDCRFELPVFPTISERMAFREGWMDGMKHRVDQLQKGNHT